MRIPSGTRVLVWCLELDALPAEAWAALDALLADGEREAIARFARVDQRRAAGAARALAKGLLEAVTGLTASDWRLGRTATGAPLAHAPDGRRPPLLSLSRTRGAVAAAVSAAGDLGVDIERVAADDAAIAEALFAPVDLAAMRGAGEGADAFTRVWTAKEAVLKALGTGFALPPSHVGVLSLDPLQIGFAPDYAAARDWNVRSVASGPFRIAAACRDGAGDAPVAIHWMRVSPAGLPLFEPEP